MTFFARAVVTGFALSLGAALFKKVVAPKLGLADDDGTAKKSEPELHPENNSATEPNFA